jgi:hypothetical protein
MCDTVTSSANEAVETPPMLSADTSIASAVPTLPDTSSESTESTPADVDNDRGVKRKCEDEPNEAPLQPPLKKQRTEGGDGVKVTKETKHYTEGGNPGTQTKVTKLYTEGDYHVKETVYTFVKDVPPSPSQSGIGDISVHTCKKEASPPPQLTSTAILTTTTTTPEVDVVTIVDDDDDMALDQTTADTAANMVRTYYGDKDSIAWSYRYEPVMREVFGMLLKAIKAVNKSVSTDAADAWFHNLLFWNKEMDFPLTDSPYERPFVDSYGMIQKRKMAPHVLQELWNLVFHQKLPQLIEKNACYQLALNEQAPPNDRLEAASVLWDLHRLLTHQTTIGVSMSEAFIHSRLIRCFKSTDLTKDICCFPQALLDVYGKLSVHHTDREYLFPEVLEQVCTVQSFLEKLRGNFNPTTLKQPETVPDASSTD